MPSNYEIVGHTATDVIVKLWSGRGSFRDSDTFYIPMGLEDADFEDQVDIHQDELNARTEIKTIEKKADKIERKQARANNKATRREVGRAFLHKTKNLGEASKVTKQTAAIMLFTASASTSEQFALIKAKSASTYTGSSGRNSVGSVPSSNASAIFNTSAAKSNAPFPTPDPVRATPRTPSTSSMSSSKKMMRRPTGTPVQQPSIRSTPVNNSVPMSPLNLDAERTVSDFVDEVPTQYVELGYHRDTNPFFDVPYESPTYGTMSSNSYNTISSGPTENDEVDSRDSVVSTPLLIAQLNHC